MNINGREYSEPELKAYIKELQAKAEKFEKAKELLKAAGEGYSFIGHITKDYACPSATSCSACPMDEGKQCRIWEHADEALALIGGDINVTGREEIESNA